MISVIKKQTQEQSKNQRKKGLHSKLPAYRHVMKTSRHIGATQNVPNVRQVDGQEEIKYLTLSDWSQGEQ